MPGATPIRGLAFGSVHVTDLARARDFYEGVLGLKALKEFGEEEVIYDFFGTGLSVHVDPAGDCGRVPGGPSGFYLHVADIERAKRDLERAEVPIVWEGPRQLVIADPDGNEFVLYEANGG